MKYLIFVLMLALSGCAQLQHGQTQPVVAKDARQGIYFTTCSGAVEIWGNCFDKARNVCEKGYDVVITREEANGGRRELTFQCKK